MSDEPEVHEPEVIEEPKDLARPGTPLSADDLALLPEGRGEKIILQRAQILATTRAASIVQTFPNDWTLFKTPENMIYGYLGDQGCRRILRLWGIQTSSYGPRPANPFYEERRSNDDPNIFSVRLTADAYCDITKEHLTSMEGFGYSDNQDAEQAKDPQRKLDIVANHARRNLDGRIVRRAGGLEAVPVEEIQRCWDRAGKGWNALQMCNKGRGFGTADQRAGAADVKHGVDGADIPNCEACENMKPPVLIRLVFRAGKEGREGFFGCPNWEKHKDKKVIIPLSKLKAAIDERNKVAQRQSGEGE